ncbi:phosphate transport system substrate-binding protein [Pseudoxanthobacter soli DSM 19599]|uniref:Phosphate-binding protein PstS n=1 Tax=Pseudoxanthobacter soli DSM 19599 TaxID=1123029 RepID=A0A1M7ZKB0_9HYPH|nr:phosphate transport system substrate-binding protein [Pseudoxanthobacter soli DSM 19599]
MTFFTRTRLGGMIAGTVMAAALAVYGVADAADISGAGATFPYPIYAKWAEAYKNATGNGLNYQSIGSGGGIKQIKAGTVTFGASDMPLKPEDLQEAGLVQFPTVIGGVVPIVNLPGIKPGELVLDGKTLADIFQGNISAWNDPAIAKLNPNVTLPSTAIAIVHRSDGSGTTFVFSSYLSQVSDSWKSGVGANTSLQWPVGIGAKGNEGVAANVTQTAGSIGYVEYAYAKQNNITYASLINAAGKTVEPTAKAFQDAAANVDWNSVKDFYVILTNEPGDTTWPISAATFILVHKNPKDPAAVAEALKFFSWAYKDGDTMAADLAYVPLPDSLVSLVEASWSQIQADGKPVYTK